MENYSDRILKAAGYVLDVADEMIEKKASKKNHVILEMESMLAKVAGEEDLDSNILSAKAIHALGLDEFLIPDVEEMEEEDREEKEEDEAEEAEDDAEEADDAAEEEKMDAIKTAQEYFIKSLALEKGATEAFNEAQFYKVAALKVLGNYGAIEPEEIQKIASMTYDEILK